MVNYTTYQREELERIIEEELPSYLAKENFCEVYNCAKDILELIQIEEE